VSSDSVCSPGRSAQYSVYGTLFWQPLQTTLRILIHTTAATADSVTPLLPRIAKAEQLVGPLPASPPVSLCSLI